MKKALLPLLVGLLVSACVPATQKTSASQNLLGFSTGDRWRMQCVGAPGADSVPIFATITNYNTRTGRADLVVTDRDGLDGSAYAFLNGYTFTMFGQSAQWSEDGRTVAMQEAGCPGGFVVTRL